MIGDQTGPPPVEASGAPDATRLTRTGMHFPCFEGLRALASVMVVVHHVAKTAGPNRVGWLGTPASVMDSGVAIFFVISGFLIYRPFIRADVEGRPQLPLRTFWWRRVLRIVPAYWLALTVLWWTGSFELGREWWRYYLFVQVYDTSTVLGGIFQAWSLCTEMTFYLAIPFWAALLRRFVRGRAPAAVLGAHLAGVVVLFASGYAFRAVVSATDPSWRGLSFSWLPANIDMFAVGMAFAVASVWVERDDRARRATERLVALPSAWGVAAVVLFVVFAYRLGEVSNPIVGYKDGYWQARSAMVELVSAALLVPAVFGDQARGAVRRLFQLRPIVWVGVVSYGLYLWHFDLIKRSVDLIDANFQPRTDGWLPYREFDAPVPALLAVGLGLGLVAAALSWYLVEQPIQRRWKRRF